ncbi:MAG: N-formylglutamate amidohydrolase [Pseudomonadota bacterium]
MTYHPFFEDGAHRPGKWLVTCDHATNTVPPFVGNGSLGISEADMARHIAYDPGAAGVAWQLAEELNSAYIGSNFSRLVIDPNRGEDDPTLVMKLYDGTIIPANRVITEQGKTERLERCYRPYDAALDRLAIRQNDTILVSIHSFTPQFRGRAPRPWHVGILFAEDERLSRPLIDRLQEDPRLVVGENEPYTGALAGDALDRHAVSKGRPHALIELRNDLIKTEAEQVAWARRLAPVLLQAAEDAGLV